MGAERGGYRREPRGVGTRPGRREERAAARSLPGSEGVAPRGERSRGRREPRTIQSSDGRLWHDRAPEQSMNEASSNAADIAAYYDLGLERDRLSSGTGALEL